MRRHEACRHDGRVKAENSVTNSKRNAATVLIIDDHPLLRCGISKLINDQPDFVVCGEVEEAPGALAAIAQHRPDLIILDVSLKGKSGIETLKDIKAQYPKAKVLILSMHDETIYGPRALRAGASGYIMKQEAPDKILIALRKIRNDDIFLSAELGARLLNRFAGTGSSQVASPMEILSDRELEVFTLLGQGNSTREVASKLNLSIKTVESHRAHIKEKLNLMNASELIRHAVQWVQMESLGGGSERSTQPTVAA